MEKASELQPGPVRHDTLTTAQMAAIQHLHDIFKDVDPSSVEEMADNFKRDVHPDKEIAIWMKVADAYQRFLTKRKDTGIEKKKEVYKIALLRSMMEEAEVKAQARSTILTEKEIEEISGYYGQEASPVTYEEQ